MGTRVERRLSDLRKTRGQLTFEGEDEEGPYRIDVWVVKLNDHDRRSAVRAADAAKARVLLDRNNEESEAWQSAYGQASALSEDPGVLAEYLSHFHLADKARVIQAEVAGEENGEWAKDDYLQGLLDLWRGVEPGDLGLQLAYAARNDDPTTLDPDLAGRIPEAIRVYEELERYEKAVDAKIEVERARFIRDHETLPVDELLRKAALTYLDTAASDAWMDEFNECRIYYSTRQFSDRHKRYFRDRAEIHDTDEAFLALILAKYDEISVEGIEGKGLPDLLSSSLLSGSSGEEEISDPSGPTSASV